jgi:hypothetical protein
MDRPDDPEQKRKKREAKPVEIRTTAEKLDKLRKIFQQDKATSIAHDPKLHERWERARAKGTPKSDETGYGEYERIRGNASEMYPKQFDGKKGNRVHHISFPRKKAPKESTNPRNLLRTDAETHKELHRLTGGKGWDMYRKKEFADHPDPKVQDSVNDSFNFQNPAINVPLDRVKRQIELSKRLEAKRPDAVKRAARASRSVEAKPRTPKPKKSR